MERPNPETLADIRNRLEELIRKYETMSPGEARHEVANDISELQLMLHLKQELRRRKTG
jgi:hypothetical protein